MDRILRGIGFLRCIQADQSGSLNTVDFFTSHEGLLLCYEEGMTRQDSSTCTSLFQNLILPEGDTNPTHTDAHSLTHSISHSLILTHTRAHTPLSPYLPYSPFPPILSLHPSHSV